MSLRNAGTLWKSMIYPASIGAAVLFGSWAVAHGWPAWAVGTVVVVAASAAIELLERMIPWSQVWRRERGDFVVDVWHFLISNRFFDLGTVAALYACAPLGRILAERSGISLWPHGWPLALQALLALAILDLPWYWLHRLGHAWPLFWRLHSVHHSAERLYWWNVARSHPFDNLIVAALAFAPLALLGVGDAPLALMAAFSGVHSTLMHSNVDARTGFLDVFLNTPRVHRWHHSPLIEESFANFSPTLTVWDWLFGTRRFDPDATPPENVGVGALAPVFPRTFSGQMRAPFIAGLWRRRE